MRLNLSFGHFSLLRTIIEDKTPHIYYYLMSVKPTSTSLLNRQQVTVKAWGIKWIQIADTVKPLAAGSELHSPLPPPKVYHIATTQNRLVNSAKFPSSAKLWNSPEFGCITSGPNFCLIVSTTISHHEVKRLFTDIFQTAA